MSSTYRGLTVKLNADTSSLSSALRSADKEIAGVAKDLKAVERGLKFNPGNVTLVTQKQQLLGREIEETAKKLELYKQVERDGLSGDQELDSGQWDKLQRDIVTTESKLQSYKRTLTELNLEQSVNGSALGKAANALESFGTRYEGLGKGLQSFGGAYTKGVTVPIAAAGAASIAAAVSIDDSLTSVKKTVDGTEQQYQQLKQAAIDFSQTNAVSPTQILDIQSLGAQLGFTIEELDEFSQVVSGLDIATNMDAETAASEMARFANITKMSHSEISNYGSAIVGLGNNFATTESEISAMAMRIAAAGTNIGMSQADILGLATALSSLGIEAEAGGTSISTIMSQIDVAVAKGSDGLRQYAEAAGMSTEQFASAMADNADQFQWLADSVGMSVKDLSKEVLGSAGQLETWAEAAGMSAGQFADAWKDDPVAALSAVLSGMEAATSEGSNMNLMLEELGITSLRQTDTLKRMAGNSGLVADAVAKSNEEWRKNSALQAEVDNRNASLSAQFEMLKNRAIAIADQFGGPLADALLAAADAAMPLFEAVADAASAFADADEGTQRFVLGAVGVVAALGPVATISGKAVSAMVPLSGALRKVAAVTPTVAKETRAANAAMEAQAASAGAASAGMVKTGAASKVAAAGMKAVATAGKLLKGAGIVALFALIGDAVGRVTTAISDNEEHTQRLTKATQGLKDAQGAASGAMETAGKAASAASLDYTGLALSSEELLDAQGELADSITGTMSEYGSAAGQLDYYNGIIQNLADKSGLTAEEQAKLRTAVEKVNEITGSSIGILDLQNGKLTETRESVNRLTQAWKDQAYAEATASVYKDVVEQKLKAVETERRATEEYTAALEKYNDLSDKSIWAARDERQALDEKSVAMWDARKALTAAGISEEYWLEQMVNSQAALPLTIDTIREYIHASEGLPQVLEANGISVDDFSAALADLGINQGELSRMTPEQLQSIVAAWDGSTDSIKAALDGYKTSVYSSLDQGTREALAAMSAALGEGTPLAQEQVAVLRGVLEQATSGLDAEAGEGTWGALNAILGALEGGRPLTAEQVSALNAILGTVGVTFPTDAVSNVQSGVDGVNSAIANAAPGAEAATSSVEEAATSGWEGFPGESASIADDAVKQYTSSIESGSGKAASAASSVATAGIAGLRSVDPYHVGLDFATGYANGISAGRHGVQSAARSLAAAAMAAVKAAQDSNSPSKKAMKLGTYVPQGYALGMKRDVGLVADAAAAMVDSAFSATAKHPVLSVGAKLSDRAATAKPASGTATTVNNYYTYLDDWILNDDAQIRDAALNLLMELRRKAAM